MIGALNGSVTVQIPRHYPELDVFESLPFGEQAAFEGALDVFLGRLSAPLSEAERQLAYAVGRESWRQSRLHGLRVYGREVRAAIEEEGAGTLMDSAAAGGGRA